jgi:hypothetical protein
MRAISIFYQREGHVAIEHLELEPTHTVGDLKAAVRSKHGGDAADWVFPEDAEEPVADDTTIDSIAGPRGAKVHLHRCRHVAVSVHFNDKTLERRFSPGTTVARVKRWAAQEQLGMSDDDASEHVLQIAGTTDRPRPNTHVGTLAKCPTCSVSFDLVPDQRVNGCIR